MTSRSDGRRPVDGHGAAGDGEDEYAAAVRAVVAAHARRRRPALPKPVGPARAPHFLEFVRRLPCWVCRAAPPSDPHHLAGPRGVGQKTDDYRCVPLCRSCHSQHHAGRVLVTDRDSVDVLVGYLRTIEGT